jgi:hypothetical protein
MKKNLIFSLLLCVIFTLSAQDTRYTKLTNFTKNIEFGISLGLNSLELVQTRPESWGRFDCWRGEDKFFSSQKLYIGKNITQTLSTRLTFQKGFFTSYTNNHKLKNSMSYPHLDIIVNLNSFWNEGYKEKKYHEKIEFKILFGVGTPIFKPYYLDENGNSGDYNEEHLVRFAYNGGGIVTFPIYKNLFFNLEAQLILTTTTLPRSFHINTGTWTTIADITGGFSYRFPVKKE